LVVLTGGPGAGKTAFLEIARRNFCEHIAVLPEAASIVFGCSAAAFGEKTQRRRDGPRSAPYFTSSARASGWSSRNKMRRLAYATAALADAESVA